jgi:Ca2+-binding RTX toxin-like protein
LSTTYWVEVDFDMVRHEYAPGPDPFPDHGPPLTFLGNPISTPWFNPGSPFTNDSFTRWANAAQGDWVLVEQPNGLNATLITTNIVEWQYTATIGPYFIAGTQPDPTQLVGPTLTDSAVTEPDYYNGPHGLYTVQWTDWIWEQITVPDHVLFTTGAETGATAVNFNNLNPDQQTAIAAHADLYHGLGGNDDVTLPDIANYNVSLGSAGGTLNWQAGTPFNTQSTGVDVNYKVTGGNGNDKINGGDGKDIITGGAGDDTISGAGGNDTLSGGIGSDTFIGILSNDREHGVNTIDGSDYANGNSDDRVLYTPQQYALYSHHYTVKPNIPGWIATIGHLVD